MVGVLGGEAINRHQVQPTGSDLVAVLAHLANVLREALAGQARLSPQPSALGCLSYYYYLRVDPKGGAPEDQHRTAPNAHLTAPWPMGLG